MIPNSVDTKKFYPVDHNKQKALRRQLGLPSSHKLVIYTVNYPLAYFAERIGNDLVEVHFPAPTGEDPAFWSPDGDTIAAFQEADLILLNGAGYAKWVERAALPSSKVVNISTLHSGNWA